MLEYELCSKEVLSKPKNTENILDNVRDKIHHINQLKLSLDKCEKSIATKTTVWSVLGSMILGGFVGYLGTPSLLTGLISSLISSLVICTSFAFIAEKYKNKICSYFKNYDSLKYELCERDKDFLNMLKNPEIKRIVISELQNIATLMKEEKNNLNFEIHFSMLIKSLIDNDYESLKNDLLKNFNHWEKVKTNTLENILEEKTQKENQNKFLNSIGVQPIANTEKLATKKDIKSML